MKHVKLFEEFVFEADNAAEIKALQQEISDIEAEMEDVQQAADAGKLDADEAELRLSDLDGQKLEAEDKIAELKKGGSKKGANPKKIYNLAWEYNGRNLGNSNIDAEATRYEADGTTDKVAKAKLLKIAGKLEAEGNAQTKLGEKAKAEVKALLDKGSYSEEVVAWANFFMSDKRINALREYDVLRKKLEAATKVCKAFGNKCDDAKELSQKLAVAKEKATEVKAKADKLAKAAGF